MVDVIRWPWNVDWLHGVFMKEITENRTIAIEAPRFADWLHWQVQSLSCESIGFFAKKI